MSEPEQPMSSASDRPIAESSETNDDLAPSASAGGASEAAPLDAPDGVVRPLPLAIEIAAVFCLAVLPPLVGSIRATLSPSTEPTNFVGFSIDWLTSSVQVTVTLLVLLALQRVDWSEFGLQPVRWVRDPLVAIVFYYLAVGGYSVAYYAPALCGFDAVYDLDWDYSFGAPQPEPWVAVVGLVVIASAANGFTEELVMRSYFMTRLRQIGWGPMPCIMATSLCFAAYHVYQGMLATLGMFIMGVLFSAYFSAERRLWPLVIAHTLLDIDGLL